MVQDGKKNLTEEERPAVVTLEKERYRQRAIARKQKISVCAVQEILKKKEETGTVEDRVRTGRPRVTSKRLDRLLKRLSLSYRKATSKRLKREFAHATGTVVCTSTIKRRLLESGLKGCGKSHFAEMQSKRRDCGGVKGGKIGQTNSGGNCCFLTNRFLK